VASLFPTKETICWPPCKKETAKTRGSCAEEGMVLYTTHIKSGSFILHPKVTIIFTPLLPFFLL
jgi:hypothetical protein